MAEPADTTKEFYTFLAQNPDFNYLNNLVKYFRKSNYEIIVFIVPGKEKGKYTIVQRYYNNGHYQEFLGENMELSVCRMIIKHFVPKPPITRLKDIHKKYTDIAIIKEKSYVAVYHTETAIAIKRKYTYKDGKLKITCGTVPIDEFNEKVEYFNKNYKGKQI